MQPTKLWLYRRPAAGWWSLIALLGLLVACAPPPAATPNLSPTTLSLNLAAGQTPLPTAPATPGRPTPSPAPTLTLAPAAFTPTGAIPVVIPPAPNPPPFAPPDPALPTPPWPIPTPVPTWPHPPERLNLLLLGNDGAYAQGGRTDSLVILSLDTQAQTAALLSLPRDLYVYIPGWTMERINLALPHGYGVDYPGGGGQLLKDTILYNTGITIDYYIRVGFEAFKRAVDTLGGVSVPVICPLTDWRLKSAELDPTVAENWELFTLAVDVHQMDGDLALWYVRSRRTTNDFERGRRQQQVLSALLEQAIQRDRLADIAELWDIFRDEVETDLDLPVLLKLAALAPAVRANGVQHLSLAGDAVEDLFLNGKWLQVLQPESASQVFQQLGASPALGHAARAPLTVEILANNAIMYRLAAEQVAWHGFIPVYTRLPDLPYESGLYPATTVTYHGPNFKGAYAELISWTFGDLPITLAPQPEATYAYQVQLGQDFNPCRSPLDAPTAQP